MKNTQDRVSKIFLENFGRTPLKERLEDILGEAIELSRFTDMDNLREETGDLLSSTLQLCNEAGWNAQDLIEENLEKIQRRSLQYKSLGRKTKVAILGGAFDPPTLGHVEVAKYVLNASRVFDEVWLMPCSSHIFGKEMALPEHRLAMCELAVRADGRIKTFDYEIKHGLSSETYKTVKLLQNEDFAKDKFDFSIIIGMDNANEFHRWVNYELLERMIRFVVVPRRGIQRNESVDWYLKPPHIYLGASETPIRDTASSQVRKILSERNNSVNYREIINNSLNPLVLEYIEKNQLYNT
jgi:nicotinate-nucleotide adenylyltransferase